MRDGQVINADFGDMTVPFVAGSIYSTGEDIFRWNDALTVPGRLVIWFLTKNRRGQGGESDGLKGSLITDWRLASRVGRSPVPE
jgi:hypothetical protein